MRAGIAGCVLGFLLAGRALGADCGLIDQIDRSRLSKGLDAPSLPGGYATPDQVLASVADLSRLKLAHGRRDEVEIEIGRQPGYVGQPIGTALRAVRHDGGWRVAALVRIIPASSRPGRILYDRARRLSKVEGAELDTLVADRCLWLTPTVLDEDIPLLGGRTARSFDAAGGVYSIRVGVQRWVGLQNSSGVGPPAAIADLLVRLATPRFATSSAIPGVGPDEAPSDHPL
jgi:hypothetical protein